MTPSQLLWSFSSPALHMSPPFYVWVRGLGVEWEVPPSAPSLDDSEQVTFPFSSNVSSLGQPWPNLPCSPTSHRPYGGSPPLPFISCHRFAGLSPSLSLAPSRFSLLLSEIGNEVTCRVSTARIGQIGLGPGSQ